MVSPSGGYKRERNAVSVAGCIVRQRITALATMMAPIFQVDGSRPRTIKGLSQKLNV